MGERIVPVTAVFVDRNGDRWEVDGFTPAGHLGGKGADIVTPDGGHQIGAGFGVLGITVAEGGDLGNLQHYPGLTLTALEIRGPGFDPDNN